MRRIFESSFGVSSLQCLQTRRRLAAKQPIADTRLPMARVALPSGFSSVRRFNDASRHYGLNPSALRRAASTPDGYGVGVRLGWRPPMTRTRCWASCACAPYPAWSESGIGDLRAAPHARRSGPCRLAAAVAVALLRWSGCTANTSEFAPLFGGDVGHSGRKPRPGRRRAGGQVFGTPLARCIRGGRRVVAADGRSPRRALRPVACFR